MEWGTLVAVSGIKKKIFVLENESIVSHICEKAREE